MADLAAVEAALRAILDPYRDRLEPHVLYGVETLRRPGSSPRDFFAGIRVSEKQVTFHLMPLYRHPGLLETISPALRRHVGGKTVLNFTSVDAGLFAELADLTARGYALDNP